jgi:hypothetical protein
VLCRDRRPAGFDAFPYRVLTAVPVAQPIRCDDFNDDVRVMHCIGTDQLNPRFRKVMDEMAKTIGVIIMPGLKTTADAPPA